MSINTIFPWQTQQWNLLWEAKKNNRLPHALLFVGTVGLGKQRMAEIFSAALLCDQTKVENQACGVCHSCGLIRANSHPDLIRVEPEQAGHMIKIDQIRHVVNAANETAMQGGYKIIIIHPAQAMNQYAANALLKTLEEATPNTLFILISEQNLRLPLTITSRCQKILFHKPHRDVALHWLQQQAVGAGSDWELVLSMADGAPLQALAFVENGTMALRQTIYSGLSDLYQQQADPLHLAAQWQEYDGVIVFRLLLYWLRDLLRIQLTHQQIELVNHDYRSVFLNLAQKLSQNHIMQMVEFVQERYRQLLNLQNLNRQLVLEELLIHWKTHYVSR